MGPSPSAAPRSAITDQFGALYIAGTGSSSVAGTVTLNATSSIYAAGPLDLSNTLTQTGLLYANAAYDQAGYALQIRGNSSLRSTTLISRFGNFKINGATSPVVNQTGPIYCGGDAVWSGTASVQTTDYTNAPLRTPGAVWVRRLQVSGTYNDVLGYTMVAGWNDTANTVSFSATARVPRPRSCVRSWPPASRPRTTGRVDFGTPSRPMVYYMLCDNDNGYANVCTWGSSGTFYGLMLLMESRIEITGGNGITRPSWVRCSQARPTTRGAKRWARRLPPLRHHPHRDLDHGLQPGHPGGHHHHVDQDDHDHHSGCARVVATASR